MKHLITILLCIGSMVAQAQTAKIFFLRKIGGRVDGTGPAFNAFIDEKIVCKINSNRYSIHEVLPGDHIVSVQFSGNESKNSSEKFKINFEPNKAYYFKMVEKPAALFGSTKLTVEEISERAAKELIEKLQQDDNCIK